MENPFIKNISNQKKLGCGTIVFITVLTFLIIQVSFVERFIGRTLAKNNAERPLVGQAWTSGLEKEISAGKVNVQEISAGVRGDLSQWLLRAQRGRPSTLNLKLFAAQWKELPVYLSSEVISAHDWQNLILNDKVDKVRPTTSKKSISITFLSSENRPIKKYEISQVALNRIAAHHKSFNDSITKISESLSIISPSRWNTFFENAPTESKLIIWNVIQKDVIDNRPVNRYGIENYDETYSLLWIEFLNPQLNCISFLLPRGILIPLG